MAKLIFTSKEHAGQVYELILEKTTVGRTSGNTLVIPDHSLSATHCEILVNGPEVIVRDLGSRNGTLVNGLRLINQQSQLKSGQTVRFGSVEARLELDEPPDETVSSITAVYSMGRLMREQQREKEKPKSPAEVRLPSTGDDGGEDKTITLINSADFDRSSRPAPVPESGAASSPAPTGPTGASRKGALIVVVMVGALLVFLWLWWSRR